MEEYNRVSYIYELKNHVDGKVVITGKVTNIPWQHLINPPQDYCAINYFDCKGDQTVVYSKEPIHVREEINVFGKAVKIMGTSKRPGSNDVFVEYHIVAEKWEKI